MDEIIDQFAEKLKIFFDDACVQIKDGFDDIEKLIKFLYSNCEEKLARILTINLIIVTNKVLSNNENVKDDIYKEVFYKILQCYQLYVSEENKNPKLLKKVLFAEICDELWTDCFTIISKICIIHCDDVIMENLFHIKRPENINRESIISNFLKQLISSNNKSSFIQGIEWTEKFNLEKLKKEEFENIIYQTHLYSIPEVLEKSLTTKKLKEKYLKALDECLEEKDNPKFGCNKFKLEFIKTNDSTVLEALINKEAEKYGINIDCPGYSIYSKKVIKELKEKFQNFDKHEFEKFSLNIIHNYKGFDKCDFINIFIDDPKYAYCWTRYLKLEEWETPYFVKICENCYQDDADEFIKSMNERQQVPLDSREVCRIFGKEYELFMITTPSGLNNFQECFIDSKPKVLGINCETHKFKISLLQLATPKWLCIIDVKVLLKLLSDSEWKNLFEYIFDPEILQIGFEVQADFSYFNNTFPSFSSSIKIDQKVLCLSKLSKAILEDSAAKNVVFSELSEEIVEQKSNLSLADIATAALGIKLDKSLQRCNWKCRPLTEEQKIYAVTDAIVVILIKEKIESDLKHEFDDDYTYQLIDKGYVCYEIKNKK